MAEIDRDVLEAQLRAVLTAMARLPRHPRGFQGAVEPVDLILVAQFRDPATGALYVADPTEVDPGAGETPEPDLFLRDYATVGRRRGGGLKIGDVLTQLLPVIGRGGIAEILTSLFKRKK